MQLHIVRYSMERNIFHCKLEKLVECWTCKNWAGNRYVSLIGLIFPTNYKLWMKYKNNFWRQQKNKVQKAHTRRGSTHGIIEDIGFPIVMISAFMGSLIHPMWSEQNRIKKLFFKSYWLEEQDKWKQQRRSGWKMRTEISKQILYISITQIPFLPLNHICTAQLQARVGVCRLASLIQLQCFW
jgi:hypothetical protein